MALRRYKRNRTNKASKQRMREHYFQTAKSIKEFPKYLRQRKAFDHEDDTESEHEGWKRIVPTRNASTQTQNF